jgi:hypothetical protein
MALMRHRGDIAAPRAIGTGCGAGLQQKLRWPVRTYCCGSAAIPEGRFLSDYISDGRFMSGYQTGGGAIKIAHPRHYVRASRRHPKNSVEQRNCWPIHIYCSARKFPGRAGQRNDSARICTPVSTRGVSLCGIFEALVAGVGGGHYRRHHGLDC